MPYKITDPTLFARLWLSSKRLIDAGVPVVIPCSSPQEATRMRFQLNVVRRAMLEEHPELKTLVVSIKKETNELSISAAMSPELFSKLTEIAMLDSIKPETPVNSVLTDEDIRKLLNE